MNNSTQKKRNKPVHVSMINRANSQAYLSDNTLIPVVSWIGSDGEDCAPKEAVVCVAGTEETGFHTVELRDFEPIKAH